MLDDAAQRPDGVGVAADGGPELGAVVQVEGGDGPGRLGRLHPLDDQFRRGLGEGGEDAAGVEPPHAAGEDRLPVEVAGLEQRPGLVGAVVEDDRRADAGAAVAVHGGHVRPADAVVRERLVEGRHAVLADAPLDHLADGVVHHRGGDAGLEAEAVRQVGGDVVLAAGHVDVEAAGLAERDDAGVEPVDEGPEGEEVEGGGVFAEGEAGHGGSKGERGAGGGETVVFTGRRSVMRVGPRASRERERPECLLRSLTLPARPGQLAHPSHLHESPCKLRPLSLKALAFGPRIPYLI